MAESVAYGYFDAPIGTVEIGVRSECVNDLNFVDSPVKTSPLKSLVFRLIMKQVEAYFKGRFQVCDLPLDIDGTPFQQSVRQALFTLPFGRTASYQQISIVMQISCTFSRWESDCRYNSGCRINGCGGDETCYIESECLLE